MNDLYRIVRVTPELVDQLSADWSPPVQVKILSRKRDGNIEELELVFRRTYNSQDDR